MLKHCGNYDAVLTNYASFLHQKCFSNLPRTYIVGVKTWIIKNIGTLHTNICWHCCPQYTQDARWFLLRPLPIIDIRAFRWRNTSWWTWCHLHIHGTQAVVAWYATWAHPFIQENYASIMPRIKSCWLCSILCWHTILKPNR